MNFLAHLHLAHLADSSLPGNLMADFVRGNRRATIRRRSSTASLCIGGLT
ncbi:phosphodiesterase [Klebsiella pneumoniae subsp. ozaenae]|uniref:Phosphodiesterase n=1 Tax=Klebsiella pneumoniae subsp. ozaenae TaxID=574 RepID=A0A377Z3Y0_KLEPO|nr:phosphodiesterase [Klebsiella pneumoniae subsp. ozaenae]